MLSVKQRTIGWVRDCAVGVNNIAALPTLTRDPDDIPFVRQRIGKRIDAVAALELEHVIACAANNVIIARAARKDVVALVACQTVVAAPAADCVLSEPAVKRIVAVSADNDIVTAIARDSIIAETAIAKVISRQQIDQIIARSGMNEVIARRADDRFRRIRPQNERIKIGQPHLIAIGKPQRVDLVKRTEPVFEDHPVTSEHAVGPKLDDQILIIG